MPGMDGTGPSGTGPTGGRRGRCRVGIQSPTGDETLHITSQEQAGDNPPGLRRGTRQYGCGTRLRGRIGQKF